jgi:hypothetical protein
MATASVARNRQAERVHEARVRDVRREFEFFMARERYNAQASYDALAWFAEHRTIRGSDAVEPEDWRTVGGWLVEHFEPLLPPPPLDVDELNRQNDEAAHAARVRRGDAYEPTEADWQEYCSWSAAVDAPPAKPVHKPRPAPRVVTHAGQPWTDADQLAHHGCV